MTDPNQKHPQETEAQDRRTDEANDGGNSPMHGPDGQRNQEPGDRHAGRHGRPSDDADEGHS